MKVRINGEVHSFETDSLPLPDLLDALDVPAQRGVAVAINDAVVSRSRWEEARVHDGDRVEIIRATQGG